MWQCTLHIRSFSTIVSVQSLAMIITFVSGMVLSMVLVAVASRIPNEDDTGRGRDMQINFSLIYACKLIALALVQCHLVYLPTDGSASVI